MESANIPNANAAALAGTALPDAQTEVIEAGVKAAEKSEEPVQATKVASKGWTSKFFFGKKKIKENRKKEPSAAYWELYRCGIYSDCLFEQYSSLGSNT